MAEYLLMLNGEPRKPITAGGVFEAMRVAQDYVHDHRLGGDQHWRLVRGTAEDPGDMVLEFGRITGAD